MSLLACKTQVFKVIPTKITEAKCQKKRKEEWGEKKEKREIEETVKILDEWGLKVSCWWVMRNGERAGVQPGMQACWQTGWVVRRWERGGHPSLLCCTVIRRPSGSSGLFELYVPLIIHLGCSALGQAHKDLIYFLAGNERTWRCWAESRNCWPCCQEIELMYDLQHSSTPTTTPPFST